MFSSTHLSWKIFADVICDKGVNSSALLNYDKDMAHWLYLAIVLYVDLK